MSRKTVIFTEAAPAPRGSYSQAVVGTPLLFTAGMGPFDPETGRIVGATIEEQTRQTLRNVGAILASYGMSWENVLKATVHLADIDRDFEAFDAAYREFFRDRPPARTTVGSRLRDILVEIDVIAG